MGDVFRQEDQAVALERIAASAADDFYEGAVARAMAAFAAESGGSLSLEGELTRCCGLRGC